MENETGYSLRKRRTTTAPARSDVPKWVVNEKSKLTEQFNVGFESGQLNDDTYTTKMNGFEGDVCTLSSIENERVKVYVAHDQIFLKFLVNVKKEAFKIDYVSFGLFLGMVSIIVALVIFVRFNF